MEAFKEQGEDFVVARDTADLVAGMNALAGDALIDSTTWSTRSWRATASSTNAYAKDPQITAIRGARGTSATG